MQNHDHAGHAEHEHAESAHHDHAESAHHEHAESAHHQEHNHAGQQHTEHAHHDNHDHAGHDPKALRGQFWLALAFTLPTIALSPMWMEWLHYSISFPLEIFVPGTLATALLFTAGRIFLVQGVGEIRRGRPGMMALIAMALVVSYGYSLFLLVAQAAHLGFAGMDFWWELSSLVTIMLLGHWLEASALQAARGAVGSAANLLPDYAEVVADGLVTKVRVRDLQVGDEVLVRAGSNVPADGQITEGATQLDESLITGESMPVHKGVGAAVVAGSLNATSTVAADSQSVASLLAAADGVEFGAIRVRVTAVGEDTFLSGVLKLVRDAQAAKSQTQLLADRAAGWLFYGALAAAMLTALAWSLIGGHDASFVLERVVTVLVIACPHALGLAVPLVSAITTQVAARNGVLIRDRMAFEAARNVDVVLFDKTGTLTSGQRGFVMAALTRRGGLESVDELLAVAAGLELNAEHSIGKAIVAESFSRGIIPIEVKDVMTIPGVGVSGRFQEFRLSAGGPALLTRQKINIEVQDLYAADAQNTAGNSVIYVVRDDILLGFVAIGDSIRETSADAVWELQALGKKVGMLTGDAHGVANSVAKQLNIDEVYAEVLPQQKAEVVQRLQGDKRLVAMVGDGINDAPALAQADVGIAIGSGTSVAVESADIVLVSDDPESVAKALSLSKRSYAKMVQNLWWAAGYNLVAIPLAAGLFVPFGLVLPPALGAILMSVSTLIVAANAQTLRKQAR